MDCQNIHYAAINNHYDCFVYYFCLNKSNTSFQLEDYILTSIAEHKYYKLIDYCLEQKSYDLNNYINLTNEKFINFVKQFNYQDIENYPFLKDFFSSLFTV